MIDNSIVKLENGFEYRVVDKIMVDSFSYVYLVNLVDKEDLVIRKEIKEEDKRYLVGLQNKEELDEALHIYVQINK